MSMWENTAGVTGWTDLEYAYQRSATEMFPHLKIAPFPQELTENLTRLTQRVASPSPRVNQSKQV